MVEPGAQFAKCCAQGLMADVAAMRVAYQGAPGAYSEGAAVAAYPDCTPIPCEQFEVAFQALSQWIADRAVLPIENSLGGSIHSVYDLLLRYRLSIVGEVRSLVPFCFFGSLFLFLWFFFLHLCFFSLSLSLSSHLIFIFLFFFIFAFRIIRELTQSVSSKRSCQQAFLQKSS